MLFAVCCMLFTNCYTHLLYANCCLLFANCYLLNCPLGSPTHSGYNYFMIKLFSSLAIIIFLAAGCGKQPQPAPSVTGTMNNPYNRPMRIGSQNILTQVATSEKDMQQGLSGREPLSQQQGMLFDYGQGNNLTPGFWMKDMKFNLDLIWIKDKKIIGITPNVPAPKSPDDPLPSYFPPSPIDAVLEVSAGWTEKYNIKVGDEAKLIEN